MPRGLLFRLVVLLLVALAAYFYFRSEAARRAAPGSSPAPSAVEDRSEGSADER